MAEPLPGQPARGSPGAGGGRPRRGLPAARAAAHAVLLALVALAATAQGLPVAITGSLDGAAYRIEVPARWNGTLALYSHGYVTPGADNPAQAAGDPAVGAWLRRQGYALAGSSYRGTGWAIEDALRDQAALLDLFERQVGRPRRTIAWGHSLGGLVAAGLMQQFPGRFSGALPICGPLAGGVASWNSALDGAFAFQTLLAPGSDLQVVNIAHPDANLQLAHRTLAAAQSSAEGRARLALVAALTEVPGWFDPTSEEPAPDDFAARQQNQAMWMGSVGLAYSFALRVELERRAGGNPSWNTGVVYAEQLARSTGAAQVSALYAQAGLSLADDLQALEAAPRVAAEPHAVEYLARNVDLTGRIAGPVLTLHTTHDGLVVVQHEAAYADAVRAAGNEALLRQVYVRRAGHCAFTPAETIAAFQVLVRRLDTGRWDDTDDAEALRKAAAALDREMNARPWGNGPAGPAPAFAPFQVSPFLRPHPPIRAGRCPIRRRRRVLAGRP